MGKNSRKRRQEKVTGSVTVPSAPKMTTVPSAAPSRAFSPVVSKWAKDRLNDGRMGIKPVKSGPLREGYVLTSKRVTPPLPAHVVGKVLPQRLESHVPKLAPGEVIRATEGPGRNAAKVDRLQARGEAKAKPGLSLSERACVKANRPKSNKGDGGGRPFVPWCQKGKE